MSTRKKSKTTTTGMTRSPSSLEKARAALEGVYDALHSSAARRSGDRRRDDFVFHMTDWLDDLDRIVEFFRDADQFDKRLARDIVGGFLTHVTPHLSTAARLLYGEVLDPFVDDYRESSPREKRGSGRSPGPRSRRKTR